MPIADYDRPFAALTRILDWIEERIDLTHVAAVAERHLNALQWKPVDRPPVTISAPAQEPFATYPYPEAFHDPTRMLVNELVGPGMVWGAGSPSIVNSVVIKDDFPLQIRANYGVGLMASLFGAELLLLEDNMPWVRPIGREALTRWVGRGVPELKGDLFERVLETMAYYKEVLAPYPKCRQAIHITQPDLQGPFDIAAELWGGEILLAFYDHPDLLRELLDLIAETYVLACRKFAAESTETVRENFIYLHFSISQGKCLLKDDWSVMLSPELYTEFIRPANEKALQALGDGGIHWCGSGDQWRAEVVETKGLVSIDWGNPDMMALPTWAATLGACRLPVSRMEWEAKAFLEVAPTRLFPTGASFVVAVDDLEQGKAIVRSGTL